jgi:hypothetical protein
LAEERYGPIAIWLGLAVGVVIAAALDLGYRAVSGEPVSWFLPSTAIVIALIATRAIWREFRAARREHLGMLGEISVAQTLEQLVPRGYVVLHDLQLMHGSSGLGRTTGGGPNIDHVVIGPAGVFVIETKTLRKRSNSGGNAVVTFDGTRVLVDGHLPDRDPIAQVRACAANVVRSLHAMGAGATRVRPVVLFPGWYVKSEPGARQSEVWVLNDTALIKWIVQEEPRTELLPEFRVEHIAGTLRQCAMG